MIRHPRLGPCTTLVVAFAATGGLSGCGLPPRDSALRPALVGTRVLVDPKVEFSSVGEGCLAREDMQARALGASLRAGLTAAGFQVVDTAGAAHEAVARASESCRENLEGETFVKVTVALDPGGKATAYSVEQAISQLVMEPEVFALAERRVHVGSEQATPAASAPEPPKPPTVSGAPQHDAFAIAIGIERYASLPSPMGARADAAHFAEVARHALGISPDHLKVAFDGEATKRAIKGLVAWASDSAPTNGRIYFYFSGLGAPDAPSGAAYIVPADDDPKSMIETALAESELLRALSTSKARDVLVILDSSFSGVGGRSVLPPGAYPLATAKDSRPPGNLAVYRAASGTEVAGSTADGSGGVFTKVLLEGLVTGQPDFDGDGEITLQELKDWVGPRVAREAKKEGRDQHPTLGLSNGLGEPSRVVVEWGLRAN